MARSVRAGTVLAVIAISSGLCGCGGGATTHVEKDAGACAPGQAVAANGTCISGGCAAGQTLVNGKCVASGSCGDHIIDKASGEQCEPPNTGNCGPDCRFTAVCGDGLVAGDEQCDPPDGQTCDDKCQRIPQAQCGNGTIESGEQCDDGANVPLDGCDGNCDYELFFRIENAAFAAGVPSWCDLGKNLISTAFGLGSGFAAAVPVHSGEYQSLLQLRGLQDLTAQSTETLDVGVVSAFPDPAAGPMPDGAVDWPYIVDESSLDANLAPLQLLAGSHLDGGMLVTKAGDVTLVPGRASGDPTLSFHAAQFGLSTGGATRPPDPTPLAPGLSAVETLGSTNSREGLCGAVSVQSLAEMPIVPIAEGNCHTQAGIPIEYHACPVDSGVTDSCNSMLDLLVNGCWGYMIAAKPTQPDVKQGGPTLTVDASNGNKVPQSQIDGDPDGYSSFVTLQATREVVAGKGKVPQNVCDPTASPYVAPCAIDEKYAIFADGTHGDDATADGSRAKPYKSLDLAVAAAINAGKRLYLCGPFNGQQLVVKGPTNGLEIYARFTCTGGVWGTNGGGVMTEYADPAKPPLIVDGVDSLLLEDASFTVGSADNSNPGESSIAGIVTNSSNVSFVNVTLQAGAAAAGAPATPAAAAAADGTAGTDGAAACSGDPNQGGPGATSSCSGSAASGGAGGPGGVATGDGGDGTAAGGVAGLGENGTGWSCVAGSGLGGDGTPGTPGTAGAGAKGWGSISASGYVGTAGQAGTDGTPGKGGGGGGGARAASGALVCSLLGENVGASGGGAGGGGCAGKGGGGGQPGGSSISLISINSSITLDRCFLAYQAGGRGGNGAPGQAGGQGGPGGKGGLGSGASDACAGGSGGPGGAGGPGGGGHAGLSIGVAYVGTEPVIHDPRTPPGNFGVLIQAGGLGGGNQTLNAGWAGIVADTFAF